MKKLHHLTKTIALLSLLLSGSAVFADSRYVLIEDLIKSGSARTHGTDVEAIEIRSPDGFSAFFASKVVKHSVPENENNGDMVVGDVIGVPSVMDSNAPYVFSLNGGWIIAEVNLPSAPNYDQWKLSVYEVDGVVYGPGSPEPYRVSISRNQTGPWEVLGVGSGTTRFYVGGGNVYPLSDEILANIKEVVATKPDFKDPPENIFSLFIEPDIKRLLAVESKDQIESELVGYEKYFEHKEHAVVEHGDNDGGTVIGAWAILRAAYQRYEQLEGL